MITKHRILVIFVSLIVSCAMIRAQNLAPPSPSGGQPPVNGKESEAEPKFIDVPLRIVDPTNHQQNQVRDWISKLEIQGLVSSKLEAESDDNKEFITVMLTLRSDEPFLKVKALIDGMRARGVTKLSLSADDKSARSLATVTATSGVLSEQLAQIIDFFSKQTHVPLDWQVKPGFKQPAQQTVQDPNSNASGQPNVAAVTEQANESVNLQMIHLKNAQAVRIAETLKQLFRSPTLFVGADDRTNAVLVRAEPELLVQIEAIVRELDQPTKSTPSGELLLPSKVANTTVLRARYEQAEQDAATKARQLRQEVGKGSGQDQEFNRIRADLRMAVEKAFAARQELHQAELATLQSRVTQIQKAISQRTIVKDQIIDRRVEDLLNPGLSWDANPTSATNQPTSPQTSRVSRSPDEAVVPGSPKTSAADGRPAKSQPVVGIPLSDAVRAFNEKYASHPIGKDQPPLTDDEVIAALRWTVGRNDSANSKKPASPFVTVVQTRSLPQDMHLEATVETEQPDKSKLWHWTIRIVDKRPNGNDVVEVVREQFIRWLPVKPLAPNHEPGSKPDSQDRNSRPLAAAIESFNIQHRGHPIGKDQPPLTVDEVIAAIRHWNTKRNEADVTNTEFDALQAIADSGRLPGSVEFEVLTGFQPNSYFEIDAWSVRIKMPRTSKPGWTYAFTIRDRWIESRLLDEREIAWGAVASNGLQAGVLLHPRNEQYAVGQRIRPQFFFRNAGAQNYSVAFPRLMTSSYYDNLQVVGDAGQPINVEKDQGPSGPVGWIEMPLPPDSVHEISGRAIVIGRLPREPSDETAILAEPGQSCRLRFTVPNFEDPKGKPLETGQIRFTVSK